MQGLLEGLGSSQVKNGNPEFREDLESKPLIGESILLMGAA